MEENKKKGLNQIVKKLDDDFEQLIVPNNDFIDQMLMEEQFDKNIPDPGQVDFNSLNNPELLDQNFNDFIENPKP